MEAPDQTGTASPVEDTKPETCGLGWHTPSKNESHICRLPKGHPPPHKCTLNTTCQATYTEPPPLPKEPKRTRRY